MIKNLSINNIGIMIVAHVEDKQEKHELYK